MNALIVIGLCALSANAQFISGVLPYSYNPNLLHSGAFTPAVAGPVTYAATAPLAYTTAAVAPDFVAPTTRTSQFHAQDELGQYNFGYAGGPSSRNEVRDAFGVVRGSYNYVDANGEIQTQSYVADALGFRVAATNLPVAPKAADAPILAAPEPVMETSEVAAARAAHQKAYDEAAAAAAAAPETRRKRSVGSVAIHSAVSPLRFSYGFNTVHPYNFPYTAPAVTYAANHAVAPAVTYAAAAPAVTYAANHAVAPAVTYAAAAPAVTYAAAAAPAVTYAAAAAPAVTYAAAAPAVTYAAAAAPAVTYAAAAPAVTYAAAAPAIAATHDAKLLRVENNPGHAVSYRVY